MTKAEKKQEKLVARETMWLKRKFRFYNKMYFNDSIREPAVIQYKVMSRWSGESIHYSNDTKEIIINIGLLTFRVLSAIVLLHEMIHLHIGVGLDHGYRFGHHIERLYMAGAYEDLL